MRGKQPGCPYHDRGSDKSTHTPFLRVTTPWWGWKHKSQLRVLELGVASSLSVLDPPQKNAQVVVGVEDFDHSTSPGYVNLPVFTKDEVAVVCQLPRMDLTRRHLLLHYSR